MNDRLFDILSEVDWRDLCSRLTLHASAKAKRLYWRTGDRNNLPGGMGPEDIVQKAIGKMLSGQRRWDPDADPDLLRFLRGVVDSEINHLAESWDNRSLDYMPEGEYAVAQMQTEGRNGTVPLSRNPVSPEDTALARENEELVLSMVLDTAEGDEDLESLIQAMMDGYGKPQEIAEYTGMGINHIYQLKRKLKRRLEHRDRGEQDET